MSRRSATRTTGLLVRHLLSRSATSFALALVVGIAVAVAALIPRALVVLSDAELQHQLRSMPPGASDLYGTGTFGPLDVSPPLSEQKVFGPVDAVLDGVPAGLPSPLSDALGAGSWVAMLPSDLVSLDEPRLRVQPRIRLAFDLDWRDRITFSAGVAPTAWDGNPKTQLPIAMSEDFAEKAGFELGDRVDYLGAPLEVSGIYTVNDPDDPFWVHARELVGATVTRAPGSPIEASAAVLIDPVSAASLTTPLQRAELRTWYPLLPAMVDYSEVPLLSEQLRRTVSLGLYLPTGEALVFETGVTGQLESVEASVDTVTAVFALAGSAPLGALLAVFARGARAVLDRRRETLQLASSRGASALQLRSTMLIEGLLVGIPAATVALGIVALALPVPVDAASLVLPGIIGLAVPALFATASLSPGGGRGDLGGTGGRARWVTELAVVGAAALAVVLLLRRGLVVTDGGGVDPLLAATPLLVSLAVCVLVLRLYPLPLLALQQAERNGSSPVGLVGATGSVRAGTAAFGSALAMVIGVSSAVFSLVLASTIATGLGTVAVTETGSDIRLEAPTLGDLDDIAAVAGVRAVAGFTAVPGVQAVFGNDRASVTVVLADLEALHRVRPDIPVVPPGSMLVSADIADRPAGDTVVGDSSLTPAGELPVLALPGLARSWVLVDTADQAAILGDTSDYRGALIATEPGADITATAATVAGLVAALQTSDARDRVEVVDTASLVRDAAARPSVAGLMVALGAASALSLLLCVIAVALGALGAARGRARTLGVLRLLGMSPGQLRGVVAWEFAPITAAALLTGTAFGVALAVGMTTLIDLRPIVGGFAAIGASVPWGLVGAAATAFAVVVAATGAVTSLAARRLNAAAAVKMGAE